MLIMFYLLYRLLFWTIVGTFYAFIGIFWLGWLILKGIYHLIAYLCTTTEH